MPKQTWKKGCCLKSRERESEKLPQCCRALRARSEIRTFVGLHTTRVTLPLGHWFLKIYSTSAI
jgi:hypothetical protein